MKAKRPDGREVFHGGCNGCTRELWECPGCCYFEAHWGLPNLNPADEEREGRLEALRSQAHKERRERMN